MIHQLASGTVLFVLMALPLLSGPTPARGDDTPDEQQPAGRPAATEPETAVLVRQLGDESYTQRERTAQRLRDMGLRAKPALIASLKADDLEVRLGAHRILVQIMQSDFERRITAFLSGENDSQMQLPGWARFAEELGDDEDNRRLYADMLRAENELLGAVDDGTAQLGKLLSERVQYLTSSNMIVNGSRQPITRPTLATVLFAGALAQKARETNAEAVQTVSLVTNRIYNMLNYTLQRESLLQGSYTAQLRKLLITWIDSLENANERYYALQLALRYDLSEVGRQIAVKALEEPGMNMNTIPYAAFILARFGTKEDAQYLQPHLREDKVFHTWSNTALKKEPIRIQVRDAVLAMIIHLHGEDPADFGFKLLQPDEITIYRVYTMGFLEDAERDAAQAKWKAFVAARQTQDAEPAEPSADTQRDDAPAPSTRPPGDDQNGDQ